MDKKRVVVVCPGRGTYTRETSGYLAKYGKFRKDQISWMDKKREDEGLPSLSSLDLKPFQSKIHMAGENASTLIFACSISDFSFIDQKKYEVVSIIGNSMGWYTSLVLGNVLSIEGGYELIHTMGSMMKNQIIGGQIIYPVVDDDWIGNKEKKSNILSQVKKAGCYISIELGGYVVIGGEQTSLDLLLKELPKKDHYPFQLPYHAAFHTPLLKLISKKAFRLISPKIFQKPSIPIIDGKGNIWSPFSTDIHSLFEYTLIDQVSDVFNFSKAMSVALKEFCPDKVLLLGPGNSLGGVIGQILIKNKWNGIISKKHFSKQQEEDPFLISLGLEDQRDLI